MAVTPHTTHSGGDDVATLKRDGMGLKNLNLRLKELAGKVAKVGWIDGEKSEGGESLAQIAYWQEFGTGSIPPRPFMRPTIAEKSSEWRENAARGAKAILNGTTTIGNVLGQVGSLAAAQVGDTINALTAPPLSPITIELRSMRRKGEIITGATVGEAARKVHQEGYRKPAVSEKPLIDSGRMLRGLTSRVEDAQ
jgi:hypothetical protein